MLFIKQNNKGMGELMNLDLDYQQLSAFGDLSPLTVDINDGTGQGTDVAPIKSEEELTLLNISGNKPVMTTVNGALDANTINYCNSEAQNTVQTSPQNIDHLLKVIENQDKQNERMLIQFRLKQVLLDYLKTRQCPKPCHPSNTTSTTCAGNTVTGSPSLCQQQNQCIQALKIDDQRLTAVLSDSKNLNGYPIGGQSPPLLTPPISPDISHQFFLTNGEQKSSTNLSFIGLNNSEELIDSQELSDSIERLYSSESEGQSNNHLTIDEDDEDFDDNNQSLFDETFDYPLTQSSTYCMTSSSTDNNSTFNTSPIHVPQTKRNTVKSDNSSRGRKKSTQSAPGESSAQMQKRSAHLSAEFRYRTKLNDKITKLRNIVGPKSQLSKSGVLSRSIDLISKLQKSNTKLKEENKKIRILLMQACNQLPGNISQGNLMIQ